MKGENKPSTYKGYRGQWTLVHWSVYEARPSNIRALIVIIMEVKVTVATVIEHVDSVLRGTSPQGIVQGCAFRVDFQIGE